MSRRKMPLWDRFMRHVSPEPNSGCWLWEGNLSLSGYGYFGVNARKNIRAHRFAYEYVKGAIPRELILDHLCRVRCCVNPDHLEPVTHKENRRRGIILYGQDNPSGRKTHCKRGHEFSAENTMIVAEKGGVVRKCRICFNVRTRARLHKKYAQGLMQQRGPDGKLHWVSGENRKRSENWRKGAFK